MPTTNNLKSGEKGVENFENLYGFTHKEKKAYKSSVANCHID